MVFLFGVLLVGEAATIGLFGVGRIVDALIGHAVSSATLVVVWTVDILVPILVVVMILSNVERSIGVGARGIRIKTWLTRRDFDWGNLRSWSRVPRGSWAAAAGLPSPPLWLGRLSGTRPSMTFWMTREQAAVVLSDPRAAVSAFAPAFREWALGGAAVRQAGPAPR